MDFALAIARSGLSTAVALLTRAASKSGISASKKQRYERAATACQAAAIALDEVIAKG